MGVLDVFNWQGVALAPGATKFTVSTDVDTARHALRRVPRRRGARSGGAAPTSSSAPTPAPVASSSRDRDGSIDPTTHDWISRPFAFAVRNPVTGTWHPRFRGHVEDHGYDMHPSRVVGEVVIEAADALAYFAGFELVPSAVGDTVPLMGDAIPNTDRGRDIAGSIFYEDGRHPHRPCSNGSSRRSPTPSGRKGCRRSSPATSSCSRVCIRRASRS